MSEWTRRILSEHPETRPAIDRAVDLFSRGDLNASGLHTTLYHLAVSTLRRGDAAGRKTRYEEMLERRRARVDERAETWRRAVQEALEVANALDEKLERFNHNKADTIRTFVFSMVEPGTKSEAIYKRRQRAKEYLAEAGKQDAPWFEVEKFTLQGYLCSSHVEDQPNAIQRYARDKAQELQSWLIMTPFEV